MKLDARARTHWAAVYSAARAGEILCGGVGYDPRLIRQALIACVKAGVLTAGEVVRARPHWNKTP